MKNRYTKWPQGCPRVMATTVDDQVDVSILCFCSCPADTFNSISVLAGPQVDLGGTQYWFTLPCPA